MTARAAPGKQKARAASGPGVRALAVLELLDRAALWEPFRGPTGARLWRLPGGGQQKYTVSRTSCTCPFASFVSDTVCKHRQALLVYEQVALAIAAHAEQLAQPTDPPPTDAPATGDPRR